MFLKNKRKINFIGLSFIFFLFYDIIIMVIIMNGLIVIDKKIGVTSHDVVNDIRHIFGTKQVGHLGTLDPLATGVLVVCVGEATKLVQF